jgi:predicted porin
VNAVQYESPGLGPVDFKVQWSTNETDSTSPPRKPSVLSMGARYEHEWFEVYGGYEEHKDLFGLSLNSPTAMRNNTDPNVRSKDKAMELGIKFKWGKQELAIEGNQKKYDETGATAVGKVRSYKNNGYLLAWDARWSPQWRTAFHYVKATAGSCSRVDAACVTDGLKGEQISFGVAYYLSKKTYLFFLAQKLKNDFAASFNTSNQQDVNPGEDLQQIALGINTVF